ncbi:unnamed protein product [Paramecium octaurelia]|uniref:Uncharacterized protein n=1 Tax=Paramecium octaurelia TaxID=43137 RepID=A0A8S1XMJ0_PAROT|nr:unnamed protein product [Paramecium octaurelia]
MKYKLYNDIVYKVLVMRKIYEIDFNKQNYYSTELYVKIKSTFREKNINVENRVQFFEIYCAFNCHCYLKGSNALNLLFEMKVDLREQSFKNLGIRVLLVGGNFLRCNFSGSEFDNVEQMG